MDFLLNMNLIIKTLNSSNLFFVYFDFFIFFDFDFFIFFDFDFFIYFDFDKINKNCISISSICSITIAYLLYTHLHDFYPKTY